MKAIKIACPHCNASIDQEIGSRKEIFCTYCGGKIILDDEVKKTEYREFKEKYIHIDKNNTSSFVDEAELQKAKNEKFSLKITLVILIICLGISLVATLVGYRYGVTRRVSMPTNSIEISFRKAVLGKATEEANLIIMEQDLSVVSNIEKDGLFEWGVFKKNKEITYCGKAIYTINLKQLRENDVVVDSENKYVKIFVPKPTLYDLIIDPNKFSIGETSKGLLSFGELKFTLEEAFYIESQAVETLKAEAEKDDLIEKATKMANDRVKELFKKTVIAVDPDYRLIIEMY